MSTITMMECEDIIEKLGGKYTMLDCDCSCGTCKDCEGCIYEQNVYLHDALAKTSYSKEPFGNEYEIMKRWLLCGAQKTLREILREIQWEEIVISPCEGADKCMNWGRDGNCTSAKRAITEDSPAKASHASELFKLLKSFTN